MAAQESTELKDLETLSIAINHLGIGLYKQLMKDGNVFFSPLSVSSALAMAFLGAQHDTAKEMRYVLGYDTAGIQDELIKEYFLSLSSKLEKSSESGSLNNANVVFSQKHLNVKDDFKRKLDKYFKALMVDFDAEPDKALEQVNNWVKVKTEGKILQLLDTIDPSTVMIILNAVYFKGFWKHQFKNKHTFLQYFYNKGIEDEAKHVEMMHMKYSFPYNESETYKAIELPYEGEELFMLILLPNSRDGLQDLENQISIDFLKQIKQKLLKTEIELAVPKFRVEFSKSMTEQFLKLGMSKVFSPGAHFGGISDSENLLISKILHKAVIEVSEEGTEAAAATAVCVNTYCLTFCPEFIVDHPFLFLIYNSNNIILFMGKIDEL